MSERRQCYLNSTSKTELRLQELDTIELFVGS